MVRKAHPLRGATDVKSVVAAIKKLAKPNTLAAWGAVFDLAIDPPKLPFKVGTSFIAMSAVKSALKKSTAAQEVLIARCTQARETRAWEFPSILLGNVAFGNRALARSDARITAGLRRQLAWKNQDLVRNAIFVLTKVGDDASLPAIVALLGKTGAKDEYLVHRISEAMVKLDGATEKDLVKLEAARKRLVKPSHVPPRIDRDIAKLVKRLRT